MDTAAAAPVAVVEEHPPRGGYRGSVAQARFTAQLVALVTPSTRRRVLILAKRHGVSQAKVLREIVRRGLDPVETGLADGSISAETLA